MPNQVKHRPETLYLPDDPSKTPLPREMHREAMREAHRLRSQMIRSGQCNPPMRHQCCADCCCCKYRTKKVMYLSSLLEFGQEPVSDYDLEEECAKHILSEQLMGLIPELEEIDQHILYCKIIHTPVMTDRQCADYISQQTGKPYSHQAVGKRYPKALERLREMAGININE